MSRLSGCEPLEDGPNADMALTLHDHASRAVSGGEKGMCGVMSA
jgi:hypothetical protein